MSLEPVVTAKIRFETTKGHIDIGLWAKELPIVSRIFIQNCLNRVYVDQAFGTVIKDSLIQVTSNDIKYNLKDEFHSRIRFNSRYMLGAAKASEDKRDGNSVDTFFITLMEATQLNGKYIVFGKVLGDSYYNVIKIANGELRGDTPLFPAIIKDIKVSEKFFDDLTQNIIHNVEPLKKKKKISKPKVKMTYDEEIDLVEQDDIKHRERDHKSSNHLKREKGPKLTEMQLESTENNPISEINAEHKKTDMHSTNEQVNKATSPNKNIKKKQDDDNINESVKEDYDVSDYDTNIDLSSDESIDIKDLNRHNFVTGEYAN